MTQTKKRGNSNPDELREKYDLADLLKNAVREKYAERYRAGTNLVLLEPEVAKAFPSTDVPRNPCECVGESSGLISVVA